MVDVLLKGVPLTGTACSVLHHTRFRTLKIFFTKILFLALFKSNLSLAREDILMFVIYKEKIFTIAIGF